MPIRSCTIQGEPGYKWGQSGKCYGYTRGDEESKKEAKKQAIAQGIAIGDFEAQAINIGIVRGTYELSEMEDYDLEDSYNDYPEAAKNNAKRALKWKEEKGSSCGTPVGWARANQLANGENISEDTINRMASFNRHRQNKDVPYDEGCGGIMWDAWGGDEGIDWAIRKAESIRNEKLEIELAAGTSFDWDGVMSTEAGKALWRRTMGRKYIITARPYANIKDIFEWARKMRVPTTDIFATGSNNAKIAKVKDLGISRHYDNNNQVVIMLPPGVGRLFNG